MAYLLDTSTAIDAYNGSPNVLAKISANLNSVMTSTLCLLELKRGLYRYPGLIDQSRVRLDKFLAGIPVLDFDRSAVDAYERIIARIGYVRGRDFDRMIAAHALSRNVTLVTANTVDFTDIPGLHLENWTVA